MAILVRLPKITREQFDKVNTKLTASAPPALLLHVSFGEGDSVEGFQVWESEEAWGSDMGRVLPVLQEAGVSTDTPPTAVPVIVMQGARVQG